jgi:CheY-like chemotaxis protein
LEAGGLRVETAATGKDGVSLCQARRPDLILLDYQLKKDGPYVTARDFIPELRRLCPEVPILVMAPTVKENLTADQLGVCRGTP